MNFARLNHILIPQDGEDRLKWLNSRRGWFLRFPMWLMLALTGQGRFLALLWIFAGAVSMNMEETVCYVVFAAITGLLVASFSLRRFFSMDRVKMAVHTPERIIAGDEIKFCVTLSNQRDEPVHAIEVEGPFLTWDAQYTSPQPRVRSLPPRQTVRVCTSARFNARGKHNLLPFSAGTMVPLGLTIGPRIMTGPVNFLVVPRFPTINGLRLPLSAKYQPGGIALASNTGESRELVGVRPYQQGDPLRDLHPRTWARTGIPHVKEYHQEFFSRVGVIVDTDTLDGQIREEEFEAALSLAAGMVAHLSRGEALIDLMVAGNKVHRLTLGRSLGFLDQALDLLACVKPGSPIDIPTIEPHLEPLLERLSSILFISLNYGDTHEAFAHWVENHGVSCRRFAVLQSADSELPSHVTTVTTDDINGRKELVL